MHTLPSTIAFKLLYALFYQYKAEIPTFSVKKCTGRLLSTTLKSNCLVELTSNSDVKKSCRNSYQVFKNNLSVPPLLTQYMTEVLLKGLLLSNITGPYTDFCKSGCKYKEFYKVGVQILRKF